MQNVPLFRELMFMKFNFLRMIQEFETQVNL